MMNRWFQDAGNPNDPRIIFVASSGKYFEGYVAEIDEIRRRDPRIWIPLQVVHERKIALAEGDNP